MERKRIYAATLERFAKGSDENPRADLRKGQEIEAVEFSRAGSSMASVGHTMTVSLAVDAQLYLAPCTGLHSEEGL